MAHRQEMLHTPGLNNVCLHPLSRIFTFYSKLYFQIMSPTNVAIHSVEDLEGCHLFSLGHAEGLPYLCVATATSITILKYNEKLKKFCKRKVET